jgi:serine/threonine-protein kinase HipA
LIISDLKYCPCTLTEGYSTYSPKGLRWMFDRRKVSHMLEIQSPQTDESVAEQFRQNSKTISISGAQFKQSLVLENRKLRCIEAGESGTYILKPIPINPPFGHEAELPANEHLTMQIAHQAYQINTAMNALVFFKGGEPAYLTKRFDYLDDGTKIPQEDFASIAGLSKTTTGSEYKYKGSYEEIALLMKKYVAAYPVEIEKFFELILFNYLFANGDAHLKNFSLQRSSSGDYRLSPAYDLINTALHIPNDSFFALEDGLFANDYETTHFQTFGFYGLEDFYQFGVKIDMKEHRIRKILTKYQEMPPLVPQLIHNAYLSDPMKELYFNQYKDRLKMLCASSYELRAMR